MAKKNLLAIRPKCAVCGNTCSLDVGLCWRRDRDGKLFDVCYMCAETHKVNEHSVDNYGPSPIQDVEQHAEWSAARAEAGYPD